MLWTPPLRRATSWRIMQISLYLGALAFSIGCLVGYKGLNALFDTDMASCILYAHATFQTSAVEGSLVSPQNCTVTMDRNSDYTCRFVYFNIICSFVYSIVGCWFFIACTSEAKTRPDETAIQSWKLVVPSIFFTFILSLMSLIGSALIDRGIASFKNPFVSEASRLQCARFKLTRVTEAPTFFGQFRVYASISESFSWLCTGCWMAGLVVLVCRCCLAADFVTQSEPPTSRGTRGRPSTSHATSGSPNVPDLRAFLTGHGWRDSLRRLNGSLKESLKSWRSDNTLYRTLFAGKSPLARGHASSPNMQHDASAAILPLVAYNVQSSTVTLSVDNDDHDDDDDDFESATADGGSRCDIVRQWTTTAGPLTAESTLVTSPPVAVTAAAAAAAATTEKEEDGDEDVYDDVVEYQHALKDRRGSAKGLHWT